MTDLRKAAEMALKLLENNRLRTDEHLIPIVVDDLRNALAQDEQEPVWCGCGDGIVANDEAKCGVCVMRLENQIERLKAQPEQEPYCWVQSKLSQGMFYKEKPRRIHTIPLYAAPPSKPWVSLTDEERSDVIGDIFGNIFAAPQKSLSLARAIEAKLKVKNT